MAVRAECQSICHCIRPAVGQVNTMVNLQVRSAIRCTYKQARSVRRHARWQGLCKVSFSSSSSIILRMQGRSRQIRSKTLAITTEHPFLPHSESNQLDSSLPGGRFFLVRGEFRVHGIFCSLTAELKVSLRCKTFPGLYAARCQRKRAAGDARKAKCRTRGPGETLEIL